MRVSPTGISTVADPSTTLPSGPAVVALGGGHGLAITLQAAQRYAGTLTAVVSVADDGGSSGRLRRDLDVVPPGDLRKCLVATADPGSVWAAAFEHRFSGSELGGHALGNLVLVGLVETLGDIGAALDEAAAALPGIDRAALARLARSVHTSGDRKASREIFRRLKSAWEQPGGPA